MSIIAARFGAPPRTTDPYLFETMGYNGDVNNTMEDLWAVGGAYVFPTSAMQLEVISSNANDDGSPVGTGARTVVVEYLDTNRVRQTETVTLNGTTAVAMAATDILRVNNVYVATVGTGLAAAGNIDVRHLTDTPIYARIPTGQNVARQAVYSVPANMTAYITHWKVGQGTDAVLGHFLLRATYNRDAGLIADVMQELDAVVMSHGSLVIPCPVPIRLAAQTDIKMSAISTAQASAICSGGFSGWLDDSRAPV